jgi:diguanylate cyclase (GGDEF)-like protein
VIEHLPSDELWRARPLREQNVVSAATVQVGPADSVAGLLGAYTFTPRAFTDRDLDFLSAVAHVLNGAMRSLEVERQIRHDALHDALTGLANRTLLLERLTDAVRRADGEGRRLALYFLDVDHLKVLNDSLGHHAGDELLRAIGPRLRSTLRPGDMIARFGGDEFAVLCDDIADEEQGLRVAERLVRAFAHPFEVCGEPRFCSISVGVVISDPNGTRGAQELLSDADAALYRAKERGRGRHEMFDVGMRDRITTRLRIEDDLRRALDSGDQLWIAYQPFVHLPGGGVAGVEALLRWTHPERGAIAPSEFIPIAEDSGLIVEIGEYVLRTACAQMAAWGRGDLRLTVNVSARQMALSGMPGTVGAVLRETGLPAHRLGLEITEGLLLEETPATVETLQALRRLGVRLMLDDFGTGYSSLGYLRRYPLDVLKIDRTFVDDLGEDGRGDSAIVEAIVGMAKALGMRVIPEGVETAGQLARLTELGCDYAQGFHLSRPLAAAELEAWL